MTTTHTFLSPSKADRWTRCTMAPYEEAKYPDTISEAAQAGIAAHEYLHQWLTTSPDGIPSDVQENLRPLVQWVKSWEDYGAHCQFETTLDCGVAFQLESGKILGTPDIIVDAYETHKQIFVVDLKYGRTRVSPVDNLQLFLYFTAYSHACGYKHWTPGVEIEFAIYQPNAADGVYLFPMHTVSWDGLNNLYHFVSQAIHKAYNAPAYDAGDIQCRWCKAKGNCEAYQQYASAAVSELTQLKSTDIKDYDASWIANMMFKIPEVENIISGIRSEAYRCAQQGSLPGWKLVRGKKSRKWANEEETLKFARKLRVGKKAVGIDTVCPRKLLSPAQMEKIPGLNDKQKASITDLQDVSYGKPALVPDSDPRPALTTDVEQYFGPVESKEDTPPKES